jgi:hypothetical protein
MLQNEAGHLSEQQIMDVVNILLGGPQMSLVELAQAEWFAQAFSGIFDFTFTLPIACDLRSKWPALVDHMQTSWTNSTSQLSEPERKTLRDISLARLKNLISDVESALK